MMSAELLLNYLTLIEATERFDYVSFYNKQNRSETTHATEVNTPFTKHSFTEHSLARCNDRVCAWLLQFH